MQLIEEVRDQSEGSISGFFYKEQTAPFSPSPYLNTARNRSVIIILRAPDIVTLAPVFLEISNNLAEPWVQRARSVLCPDKRIAIIEIEDIAFRYIRLHSQLVDGTLTASVFAN